MHFDEETFAAIARHLDERWPPPRTCPVCGCNPDHWRVSDTPVLLPLLTGTSSIDVHDLQEALDHLAAAPVVTLTCSVCGHVLFFSVAKLNVVPMDGDARPRFSIPSE